MWTSSANPSAEPIVVVTAQLLWSIDPLQLRNLSLPQWDTAVVPVQQNEVEQVLFFFLKPFFLVDSLLIVQLRQCSGVNWDQGRLKLKTLADIVTHFKLVMTETMDDALSPGYQNATI